MADLLQGLTLSRKDGSVTTAADLQGKIVGFYFSAHWCPPCRLFTPELAKFYSEVGNDEFEIVFVSFDRNADEAKSYLSESHGNWLYVLPNESIANDLSSRFDVNGIPTLVVVKSNGGVITKDGRAEVSSKPSRAVLSFWKTKL